MPAQEEKVLTSLTGEYYVAAELCRRGFMASLTLKDYPAVDIFALDPVTQQQVAIQVKTARRSKGKEFWVPETANQYKGIFVFVVLNEPPQPAYETFLMTGMKVHDLATAARNEYLAAHPIVKGKQPFMLPFKALEPFRDNWSLLASGNAPTSPLP